MKMQPENADALLELGLVHAALQDYGRSVYVLAQARQHASKRSDVLLALARAAEDAGFYGDSIVAYDEYLQLSPNDDSARRDRARVLGQTGGRLTEGIRELTVYVQRHPNDSIGHYYLGQLTWMANQPQEALEQLSTALRLDVDLRRHTIPRLAAESPRAHVGCPRRFQGCRPATTGKRAGTRPARPHVPVSRSAGRS